MLTYKVTHTKKLKEKLDEITNSLEYIEGHLLKSLIISLTQYMENPDEDNILSTIEPEIQKALERADSNRKV